MHQSPTPVSSLATTSPTALLTIPQHAAAAAPPAHTLYFISKFQGGGRTAGPPSMVPEPSQHRLPPFTLTIPLRPALLAILPRTLYPIWVPATNQFIITLSQISRQSPSSLLNSHSKSNVKNTKTKKHQYFKVSPLPPSA
jgi:hypothetical protein